MAFFVFGLLLGSVGASSESVFFVSSTSNASSRWLASFMAFFVFGLLLGRVGASSESVFFVSST